MQEQFYLLMLQWFNIDILLLHYVAQWFGETMKYLYFIIYTSKLCLQGKGYSEYLSKKQVSLIASAWEFVGQFCIQNFSRQHNSHCKTTNK